MRKYLRTHIFFAYIFFFLRLENYNLHFNWYPFTGEEAPMPIEDIDDFEEDESEEEESEEEEGDELPEFMNYWNNIPLPGSRIQREMQNFNLD